MLEDQIADITFSIEEAADQAGQQLYGQADGKNKENSEGKNGKTE